MKFQIFNIVFSLVLFPVNFGCAFWLLREALNLTGMTLTEFTEKTYHKMPHLPRHRQRRIWKVLAEFFYQNSVDAEKSLKLTKIFGVCTIPGLLSLALAAYSAVCLENIKYAFVGNIIILAANIIIFLSGKKYRRNSLADRQNDNDKKLNKEVKRKISLKSTVVYLFMGLFFFAFLLFFMLMMAGTFGSN